MFSEDLYTALTKYSANKALCIRDVFYSYEELLTLAGSICGQIENAGLSTAEQRTIGILCTDDIRTYASLIAVWFSGCAYVPLGLHNPVERNLAILGNAGCTTVLSTQELTDLRYSGYRVITPGASSDPAPAVIRPARSAAEDRAYILFTSGTTGNPKGVPISYGNLAAFVRAFLQSPFAIGEEDRCLQMFDLSFDVSISSFLLPLLKGACVYTIPDGTIKYVGVLRLLQQYGLTNIQIVPSVIRLARPLLANLNFPSVRQCILTGEATPVDLLPLWEKCIPNAEILNYYGPTEATIYTSFYRHRKTGPVSSYNGLMAIGRPLNDMTLLVVDEKGEETAAGEKGELLIGGPQLTAGYVNNPQNNTTAFLEKGTGDRPTRFYRSGDLCFRDAAGDLFYCGRIDNQVKIRGYRVELGEIEFHVRKIFDINCVVVVFKDKTGMAGLEMVLEIEDDSKKQAILDHLKRQLPDYMIPSQVRVMKQLPLNSSGKTDRKKIKELANEPS